jgi:hypothetical protein
MMNASRIVLSFLRWFGLLLLVSFCTYATLEFVEEMQEADQSPPLDPEEAGAVPVAPRLRFADPEESGRQERRVIDGFKARLAGARATGELAIFPPEEELDTIFDLPEPEQEQRLQVRQERIREAMSMMRLAAEEEKAAWAELKLTLGEERYTEVVKQLDAEAAEQRAKWLPVAP